MLYYLALSTAAMCLAFLLDLLLGDPEPWPHLVRGIGKWIAYLEKHWLDRQANPATQRKSGLCLVLACLGLCFFVVGGLLLLAYRLSAYLGCLLEAVICYQCLAIKSLREESLKVWTHLNQGELTEARQALSMIVGRDTAELSEEELAKAAVETVAENTTDAVVAPLLYMALGGALLATLYKAVNTMDSMIAYKNERYLHFGRAAALLDDGANYLPARLAARLMLLAASPLGFDAKRGRKIYKRDRAAHPSPNAGHTEAACAGILGVALGGDAYYGGKRLSKAILGDAERGIEAEDIKRSHRLMYTTACAMFFIGLLFRFLMMGGIYFACT